jgi:hypothetical protein
VSARRQAAADAKAVPVVGTARPPAELLDPGHEVWRHRDLYWAFISDHGLDADVPVSERMGPGASPANRRNYASAAWGVLNGITDGPGSADWHRLRASGLTS